MLIDINPFIEKSRHLMEHSIEHLQHELHRLRTGKANTDLLEGLLVEYYGHPTILSQVATISTADARTLTIQPWEKNMLGPIEKAIFEANLGITPQNDGQIIRISVPPLTEERRKELVKKAKHVGEESKVGARNARRDAIEHIKKAIKDGLPEDEGKRKESEVDDMTKRFIEKIEKLVDAKEKEIMTV